MNKLKYSLLSVVTASLLIGCGSSSKDEPIVIEDPVETQSEFTKLSLTSLQDYSFEDVIKQQDEDGWVDADDTSIKYLSASNGKVLTASKYHIALTVLDTVNETAKYNSFATLSDHGHNTDSASGASESKSPEDAQISIDGNYAYINLPAGDNMLAQGLYRTPISADASVLNYDEATVVSYSNNSEVDTFSVSSDAVALINEDYLVVTSLDLQTEKSVTSNELETEPETYAVNSNGSKVYTVYKDESNGSYVTMFTDDDGTLVDDAGSTYKIGLSFEAESIKLLSDTKAIVANLGNPSSFAILDLENKIAEEFTVGIGASASAFDISPNSEMLAIVSEDLASIIIYNIEEQSIQTSYTIEEATEFVAFVSNTKLSYIKDENYEIEVLEISDTGIEITGQDKLDRALSTLTEDSITTDSSLLSIKNDLNLATAYGSVTIDWTSTLSTNINVNETSEDLGMVTRPNIGDSDVSGTLTANVTTTLNGTEYTSSKDYDVKVIEAIKTGTITDRLKLTEETSSIQLAVGYNGRVASINEEEIDGEDAGVIFILDSDETSISFYNKSGDTDDNTPFYIFEDEKMPSAIKFLNENTLFVVASNDVEGSIYTFTINDDATLTQDSITNFNPIETAKFNNDKSMIALFTEDNDGLPLTTVYSIDDVGEITLSNTITMNENIEYDVGKDSFTISDDGKTVYIGTKNEEIYSHNTSNESNSYAIRTDAEIGGISYYNETAYVMDRNGRVVRFKDGDLSNIEEFDSGHDGRLYTLIGNGDELYLFIYDKSDTNGGLSIVDEVTFKEKLFVPYNRIHKRSGISDDGQKIYAFSYVEDEEEDEYPERSFIYINLNN